MLFFRELARGPRCALLATSGMLSAELLHSVGLRASVVLPPSLFLLPMRRSFTRKDVLLHGRLFLDRSPWLHLLRTVFADGWVFDTLSRDATTTYKSMSSAFAVAFFLHAHELLAVTDFYALAVPILAPDWTMMLEVERLTSFPATSSEWFSVRDGAFGEALSGGAGYDHPFAPFWSHSPRVWGASPEHFGYWWRFSYCAILPHIIEFVSIPDFVSRLHALPRDAVAAAIAAAHAELARASLRTVAAAVARLAGSATSS